MKGSQLNKIGYSELNKKLEKNEISPVYVFAGDQLFLMDQALEELKKKVLRGSGDFNFSLFYGDSSSSNEIINSAKTYPMLSTMRMVVVKNADKLPVNELLSLEPYLFSPSPYTCLVLILQELTKLPFDNKGNFLLVQFVLDKKDLAKTIKEEARNLGYEITKDAADMLVLLVGDNLQSINAELQKLAISVGNRKKIESQDVQQITEKVQFEDVFQLINAIFEKNKKKALKVLLELESKNEDALSILNKLSWRFRLIWRAKEFIDNMIPEKIILKELRISPGQLYYIKREAKNFNYSDVKLISGILCDCDRRLKTSGTAKSFGLTKLVLELAR